MAISEICKFEVKEEIDRAVELDGVSRNEASKRLAKFFTKILGLDVKPATVRQKDLRARQEENVATNVATKTESHSEPTEETTPEPLKKKIIKKIIKPKIDKKEVYTEDFMEAYELFYSEIQNARLGNWKETTQEAALYHTKLIMDLIVI